VITVPASESGPALADWAELSCLFGPENFTSRAKVAGSLEAAGIVDTATRVDDVWNEIGRRHDFAAEGHPVQTTRTRLARVCDWTESLPYAFQLLLSTHAYYPKTRIPESSPLWKQTSKLFETLTSVALQGYMNGRAINVGAPRPRGVPKGFRDCLEFLTGELYELRGSGLAINSNIKDDHLDVIAWIPFGDARSGQIIVLVNCAAGGKWERKSTELKGYVDIWREHINWATPPLTAFAFPHVCAVDTEWLRLSRAAGILLDRLRISDMLGQVEPAGSLQRALAAWCRKQARRLPWQVD
jgi:hypothetical protein